MRASRLIAALLGAGLAAIALLMLAAPTVWYDRFPGVSARGPLNHHFVRDLACAFLVAACSFLYAAARPSSGRGLVVAAAGVLVLHAGVHLAETIGGDSHSPATDLFTVYLPAALALACAAFWGRSSEGA